MIEYNVGDKVTARWKGGNWYAGTVTKVNEPEAQEDKEEDTAKEDVFQVELPPAALIRLHAIFVW